MQLKQPPNNAGMIKRIDSEYFFNIYPIFCSIVESFEHSKMIGVSPGSLVKPRYDLAHLVIDGRHN